MEGIDLTCLFISDNKSLSRKISKLLLREMGVDTDMFKVFDILSSIISIRPDETRRFPEECE